MILVDNRIGSADIAGHLRHWHLPVDDSVQLPFGDAAFAGNGPQGRQTVACGIEIKAVKDALQCMSDGRFAGHQLRGMVKAYDRRWMIVEGRYRPDFGTGLLLGPVTIKKQVKWLPITLGTRQFMYRDLDHWLSTMEEKGAVRVRRSADRVETARIIADLYTWWTAKDYDDHNSHLVLYNGHAQPDRMLFQKPSLLRMVASELPGVGWKKSQRVCQKFRTVKEMVNALKSEWAEIDGIGETLADRIWNSLRK